MTPSLRKILPGAAVLFVLGAACDEAEPDVEFRDGATAQFKTQSTDQSFKWKGCEPPWGPDPYKPESEPDERWLAGVGARIEPDLHADVLGNWRDGGGAAACEEGCASLERAWTGDARPVDTHHAVRGVRAIGHCDDKSIAWSVEVAVDTAFECACE